VAKKPVVKAKASVVKSAERNSVLAQLRNHKMARSAHAYVRGNTVKFYDWLEQHNPDLPQGPAVWICGDCHVGNLGPISDKKGRVAIQIRDLDQTVIGNPAHDLIRLGLSLASAARGSDLPGVTTAHVLEMLIGGYRDALAGDFELTEDRTHRPKTIQRLLSSSVQRRWRHLAEERLHDVSPSIPLGKRFWHLSAEERNAVKALVGSEEVQTLVTSLRGRSDKDPLQLVDVAYWVKGCSSLGSLRYAVLVRVGEGEGSSLCLLDIKEALSAAAPRAEDAKMPRDNAMRVVTGAKALSPNLGNRMLAARLLERPVFLRELRPQDLKIELGSLSHDEARNLSAYLGQVLGRAHGRQMDAHTRAGWAAELGKTSSAKLDAPYWLWSAVVELVAQHEVAYLEHCRKYALQSRAA